MAEALDEFLIKLGAGVDESSFQKFASVLNFSEQNVDKYAKSVITNFIKLQAEIVGAFTAVSAAVLTLVDKTISANTSYRIFGESMLMTTESARKMKMATDALGLSLEQIIWDPLSAEKFKILTGDIEKNTPGNFQQRMQQLEMMQFQVTRVGNAFKLLAQDFTVALFGKLGGTATKDALTNFVDNLLSGGKIERLGNQLATFFAPILKETLHLFRDLFELTKMLSDSFSDFIGVLTGDTAINDSTNSFEKLGLALSHVVGWARTLLDVFLNIGTVIGTITGGAVGTIAGGILGGAVGGPLGAIAGMGVGGTLGAGVGGLAGGLTHYGLYGGPKGGAADDFNALANSMQTYEGWKPGTVSYRNNNPGNLVYGAFAAKFGGVPGDKGFAKFPSYDAGRQAELALIQSYASRGYTLSGMMNKWAPSNENDTKAYIKYLSAATGIGPNQKLGSPISIQNNITVNALTNDPHAIAQVVDTRLSYHIRNDLAQVVPNN